MNKKELEAEVKRLRFMVDILQEPTTANKIPEPKKEEPKLEVKVGEWYKSDDSDNLLVCWVSDDMDNYGFNRNGIWSNSLGSGSKPRYIKATHQEVETALIAEANLKYPRGTRFKSVMCNTTTTSDGAPDVEHLKERGIIYFANNEVYNNGKWATIIEDKPPVVNGYDMEISDGLIKFGCAVLFPHDLIELNNVIQKSKISFNCESAIQNRKIKSITLDSGVEISVDQLKEICEYIDKSK